MAKDSRIEEFIDEDDSDNILPPRRFFPDEPRRNGTSSGSKSVRKSAFLSEGAQTGKKGPNHHENMNEEFSELGSNDVVFNGGIKLPGQPHSPQSKHTAQQLIKPAFGALLSIEEFQDELDQELRDTFGEELQGKDVRPTNLPAKDTFVAEVLEDADDGIAVFAPDEAARADVQNQQLQAAHIRLDKLREKAKVLEDDQKRAAEINKALKVEVKRLKTQHIDIEERVEDLRREGEATGLVKAASAAEEKKFRELEMRMKREEAKRKALELGLDTEDEEFELPGDRFGIIKSLQQTGRRIRTFFHRVDGMYVPARRAESRFGSGIALFFWFYRWMMLLTLWLTLVWVIYLIIHIVDFARRGQKVTIVGGIIPTIFVFSAFQMPISYAIVVSITLLFTVSIAIFKFIHEFRVKHKADVYQLDSEPARYGKIAFNAWDWGTSDEGECRDLSSRVASLLQVLKLEDQTAERVAARTQREWSILYTKRAIGITFNVLCLLAGLAGITISKIFLGGTFGSQFSGFLGLLIKNLPVVIPTAINGLLPQITNIAVDIEAWDDPSTILKMRVGRLYFAKIMNALIQVLIVLIFFRGPIPLFNNQRVLLRDCEYATCEDQMGIAFFTLFVTDVIIGTISTIVIAALTKVIFTALRMPTYASSEFQPPVQLIKILYQQMFLWLSFPHFPLVVPVALILWFIQFKVDAFVLFNFNSKPLRPFDARDSSIYFVLFFTITLFLFGAWMYYVFFVLRSSILDFECCRIPELILSGNSTVRICFASQTIQQTVNGKTVTIDNTADVCQATALSKYALTAQPTTVFQDYSMSKTLSTALAGSSDSSWFLEMVDTALLGYFAATCCFILFMYEKLRVHVLERYLDEKLQELSDVIASMETQVRIKQKRIELITTQSKDDDEL